ncbi:MAG: hypothetical protein L3J41_00135 [Melioribacteraceae bacterium]|nr:hypothetical protein [Melioribacteraceae bacterium]
MLLKRKFIYALVVVTIVLIISNILLEVNFKKEKKTIPEVSLNEIELKFSTTLSSYGILSDWIKKKYVNSKLSDSLDYIFNVTLPQDVSIPTLIKDLNNSFNSASINIETTEKKNYSNTRIKIYSNEKLKLQANLKHSKKIIRKYAEYSFLLYVDFNNAETNWKEIKNIFYDFTYLITPSKAALEAKNNFDGKYAMLLNDQLRGTEYALEEDYSKQKLINRIRSIVISFGKDKIYLIDETSALFNSKIYSLLRDEFSKRGIRLISLQKYPKLKGNTNQELISLFQFYTTSLKGKEGKTFVLNLNDFLKLQPHIDIQIKIGDRVVEVKF